MPAMDLSNSPLQQILDRIPSSASAALLDELGELLRAELASPTDSTALTIEAAYNALQQVPASLVCAGRVSCLLGVMNHYYRAGRPAAALGPVRDAVEVSRRLGDRMWLCKSLKLLGVVLADSRDIPGAIESYAEAIEIARAQGDVEQECALWINTGVAHNSFAHYADAVACYEKAIELADARPAIATLRQVALSNIAQSSLQLGDLKHGLAAIRQVLKESREPASAGEMLGRVHYEYYYARLLLEAGAVEQARDRAKVARRFAERSKLARADALATIAAGLTDVHAGNVDIGLTRLKRALERARSETPSLLHDSLAALVWTYEKLGQPDAALVYLREIKRLHQDGRESQVLMHHTQHLRRIDHTLDTDATATLELRQTTLRSQLSDRDLTRSRIAMLEQQSVAAELHDDTTGEHCYRVGRLSSLLAQEYGVDDHTCFLIDLAARMHDIGKLAVPDAILLKPGKFTPEERAIMETHTTAGAELLAKSNVPQMYVAEEIARHHHERFDGNGYPAKLKGSMIPLAARITALADVFDALTHVRPYKTAWSVDDALKEIASLRGKHFDPELTDLFLALVPRLQREKGDLDRFLAEEAQHSPFIRARRQLAAALKRDVNDLFDTHR